MILEVSTTCTEEGREPMPYLCSFKLWAWIVPLEGDETDEPGCMIGCGDTTYTNQFSDEGCGWSPNPILRFRV